MKRFLFLMLGACMLHSAFAVCNDTVADLLILEVFSPANGVQISWTPSPNFGVTYDIRVTRVGYPGVQAYEEIPISSYFIPYSDFFCGEHNFYVRVNCPDGESGKWSKPLKSTLSSEDCIYSTPAVCPDISLNATGSIYGFMPEIPVDCNTDTVEIRPSFNVSGGVVTNYTVQSIAYAPPYPFNVGTQIFVGADDVFSAAINLPFPFCFFEPTYSRVAIGANGLISFNANNAGQFNTWNTGGYQNIPNATAWANDLKNAICIVMEDVDPPKINTQNSGGSIRWALLGSNTGDCESCRTLVVNFHNVPLFSCNEMWQTYQAVLYEGSNIIDIFVEKRNRCPGWNSGHGVIGVLNSSGTKGISAPGRNITDVWSTIGIDGVNRPEAWRFTPVVQANNSTITWYRGNYPKKSVEPPASAKIHTGEVLRLPPNSSGLDTITVRLQILSCNGCNIDIRDVAVVRWEREIVEISDSTCQYKDYNRHGFFVPADSLKWERIYKTMRSTHTEKQHCDTTFVLKLKVIPNRLKEIKDTVCPDSIYMLNNKVITTAGYHTDTLPSSTGCDSVVILKLSYHPVPNALPPTVPDDICAGDSLFYLQFSSSSGQYDIRPTYYSIAFDSAARAEGFVNQNERLGGNGYLVTVRMPNRYFYPGIYTCVVTLYDPIYNCTNAEFDITFPVHYPSSIMEQKWNNVIAVLNQYFNGGNYEFTGYQWYKNGIPIPNSTDSYYYAGAGNVLDTLSCYTVELTRKDGTKMFSCPFCPGGGKEKVTDYPTYMQQGNTVTLSLVKGRATVKLYTVTGVLVYSNTFNAPSHTFSVPTDGIYLLDVRTDYGANKVFPIVVRR